MCIFCKYTNSFLDQRLATSWARGVWNIMLLWWRWCQCGSVSYLATVQLFVACPYCSCLPPSTVAPGFCQDSMHHCIYPLLRWSHSSSVLPSICSVTWAKMSKTLLQIPGRLFSKHLYPWAHKKVYPHRSESFLPSQLEWTFHHQKFSIF